MLTLPQSLKETPTFSRRD